MAVKQYGIDGLSLKDYTVLKGYLDSASIGGIYWLELERELLTPPPGAVIPTSLP